MLDLNDAYAIAKFIKDAEKQTPVKVYVSTTAEIAKAESFKVFGNNGEYT
ncbi:MAG: 2,3,4,5-tetrahydropyridine-2,6-dicarboxylate N-acetyltransferase, partial [Intestinibacter bartlettii]|nr:2,3,4,5-tetrahydropyridine-2,6-dicarboxylate N-acetyltransferase [Intestinibacter bartlettii]